MKGRNNSLKITLAFHFVEINTCEKPGRGADAEISEMKEAEKTQCWRQLLRSRQKDSSKQNCLQLGLRSCKGLSTQMACFLEQMLESLQLMKRERGGNGGGCSFLLLIDTLCRCCNCFFLSILLLR